MELWAGELGAAEGKSVVGTEITLEWSTEESGGLALTVGHLALARMGFVHPVLGIVLGPSALHGLDRYPAGLLTQFAADTNPTGICSRWPQGRSYPERQQIITRV